jgi:amino acid adenylation domain-containing protein
LEPPSTWTQVALVTRSVRPEAAGFGVPPIAPTSRQLPVGVSPAQEQLLFLEDLQPGLAIYNLPIAARLQGRLDVAALESAFSEIVRRHEVLRTNYEMGDGGYVQVVAQPGPVFLGLEDLRSVPAAARDGAVRERIAAEVTRPFDLQADLKIRGLLLRTADEVHVLVTTMHRIASDHSSVAIFGSELAALYESFVRGVAPTLAPLALQYADFTAWQQDFLTSSTVGVQLEYWAEQLSGELPVLDVPADRPRSRARTFASGTVAVDLSDELVSGIWAGAQAAGVTPCMFMLAAYVATLARWSGQDDLVVGTALANRRAETMPMVGPLDDTLALRVRVDPDAPFTNVLGDVKHVTLGAIAHRDVPFTRVVERVRPRRDLTRAPIFQTMFGYAKETAPLFALDRLVVDRLDVDAGAIELDLSVRVVERATGTTALFEYSADLFDAGTVERLAASWGSLLEAVVADASVPVAHLPLMNDDDRRTLIADFGRSQVDVLGGLPPERCTIHGLVSATVESSPDRVAVRMGVDILTYQELDDGANRLARHLHGLGVGPGALVGVSVERSVTMVVALLGIMKAGAAYLPLDPGFPTERLEFMVEDANVQVVLTSEAAALRFPGTTVVDIVSDWPEIERQPATACGECGGGLAYVIYTSGSTGTPKGVEIEHRNAVNFLLSMLGEPGLVASDVVLGLATLSFDISVLEVFLPLVVGAEVVIASREDAMDGERLAALIRNSAATVVQGTPTTFMLLFDAGWQGDSALTVLCGGDAMSIDLARRLLASCGTVWNVFGPTETTVWSTVFHVTEDHTHGTTIPIGRPIAGVVCRVVDSAGGPVPIGVPGELVIGGEGVARGYLRRPELTAERFPVDPYAPHRRVYRTNDLVRWRPDGALEYMGRLDHQLKIRGHRIEPGEIEAALRGHPLVRDAVVVARGKDHTAQLVAYIIATDPSDLPTVTVLRRWLERRLPEYMIPSCFVPIDSFPMTPSRKIDRKALPQPRVVLPDEEAIAPRDDLEATLGTIWADVLGRPSVGVNQNFFDLGGYSLLATRVFALIEERTGHRLPMSALFDAPTIAELADAIRSEGWRSEWTSLVPIQRSGTELPFFYVAPYEISVLQFAHLGEALLPDRPLYGFQPQGLDGRMPTHETIEETAAHYISEMKSVQPHGPYAIGGHCSGSWVAFEMARQLEDAGDELAAVVLVDQGPPGAGQPRNKLCAYLLNRIRFHLRDGRFRQALMWKLRIAVGRHLVRRIGPPTARHVEQVRAAQREAFRRYTGNGRQLHHDLVLVRSAETLALADKSWFLQWADRTEGSLRTESVPGTHHNLLERQHVGMLAATVRAALKQD